MPKCKVCNTYKRKTGFYTVPRCACSRLGLDTILRMPVCGSCAIIPNNNYTIVLSVKRDTCCKCRKYKEYVEKLLIKN